MNLDRIVDTMTNGSRAPVIDPSGSWFGQGTQALDKFVEELDLPPYLAPEPAVKMGWLGHPTLISKICRGTWQTEALTQTKDRRLTFGDPARHFDIHFEMQVPLWKSTMGVFLHYETNPYFSQAKLKAMANSEDLEQYYRSREAFLDELARQCRVPGFDLSRLPVQIGKARCDFAGRSREEMSSWLREVLEEVAAAVDWTLNSVGRI
jgi:hypothetical protein